VRNERWHTGTVWLAAALVIGSGETILLYVIGSHLWPLTLVATLAALLVCLPLLMRRSERREPEPASAAWAARPPSPSRRTR